MPAIRMTFVTLWERAMPAILLMFVFSTQCQGSLEPPPASGLMAQRSLRDFPHRCAALNGAGSRICPIFIASIFHPGKSSPKPPNDSAFRNRPKPGGGPSERWGRDHKQ
jgi:hypothetical protein